MVVVVVVAKVYRDVVYSGSLSICSINRCDARKSVFLP